MKTSSSLIAAAGFAAIAGLVIWASVARETIPTESVFDTPPVETPAEEKAVTETPEQTEPSNPLERTVRALSQEAAAIGASPRPPEDDPIAQAEQAIARADAALTAAGLSVAPAPTPTSDTARSARLNELQDRLDQLPR